MKLTYKIDDEVSLRLIEPRHAEELFAVVDANRETLLPWMRWTGEVTDAEVLRGHIKQWLTQTAETGCMSLGVELDGELVGVVFHIRPDVVNKQVEVGYWLAVSARGRGVATRAVRAMCDITFRDLGFNRINVRVAPENTASLGVAERLGMTREGVSRQAWRVGDEYWDAVEFGLLADEWDVTSPAFSLSYRVDDELELRLPEPRHAEQAYALIDRHRKHIERWLSWCIPGYALCDAQKFIKMNMAGLADGGGTSFWMVYRGELVGGVGSLPVDQANRSADVGYWMAESMQGRGIATRASKAVLDFLLIDMGLNRVTIHAATENHRSLAIPERLKFRQIGTKRKAALLHEAYVDYIEYEMLAEDWKRVRDAE